MRSIGRMIVRARNPNRGIVRDEREAIVGIPRGTAVYLIRNLLGARSRVPG